MMPAVDSPLTQHVRAAPVTTGLSALILAVAVVQITIRLQGGHGGLERDLFTVNGTLEPHVYSPITSTFAHGHPISHLLPNLLGVFWFGRALEEHMRWWQYLGLFLFVGAASGTLQSELLHKSSLGASGAAAMLMVGWLVLRFDEDPVIRWLATNVDDIRDSLRPDAHPLGSSVGWLAVELLWWGLFVGFLLFTIDGLFGGDSSIGHIAHLVGFFVGLVVAGRIRSGREGDAARTDVG